MRIGMVGLGRMGANMSVRLMNAGHEVVGYDRDAAAVSALGGKGGGTASDSATLVAQLDAPRVVWFMLPAAVTTAAIMEMAEHLEPGDVVVDGGNSHYPDDIARSRVLEAKGIHYVDAGVSGGVWGLERGYCLMVGGTDEAITTLTPILETLAPGVATAPRTPGREGPPTPAENGWLHCGPAGAGHFVKMVHNGIEYGLMQAYAEGFALLKAYDEPVDLQAVSALWNHGSVVRSWLLELAERAFTADPALERLRGYVDDSGEGRWTVIDAVERGVPAHVLATALFDRFDSRDDNSFAMRVLAALRNEFGGHAIREA